MEHKKRSLKTGRRTEGKSPLSSGKRISYLGLGLGVAAAVGAGVLASSYVARRQKPAAETPKPVAKSIDMWSAAEAENIQADANHVAWAEYLRPGTNGKVEVTTEDTVIHLPVTIVSANDRKVVVRASTGKTLTLHSVRNRYDDRLGWESNEVVALSPSVAGAEKQQTNLLWPDKRTQQHFLADLVVGRTVTVMHRSDISGSLLGATKGVVQRAPTPRRRLSTAILVNGKVHEFQQSYDEEQKGWFPGMLEARTGKDWYVIHYEHGPPRKEARAKALSDIKKPGVPDMAAEYLRPSYLRPSYRVSRRCPYK